MAVSRSDAQVSCAGEAVGSARLAVFDLDRTLLPGASAVALVRALVAHGHISRRRLARACAEHALYRRRGSTDAQIERVRQRALSVMAGLERDPIVALADRVAQQLVAGMTSDARLVLDRHLADGDFCVLLSASPHELVESIGRRLGLHRSIGTKAGAAEGRFTGGLDGPFCYGAQKLSALRQSLGEIDTSDAWAYADSASDVPLLEAVGHPVAVNPDRRLRRVASERGWQVVRFQS
jgi:HAD superfamily hydrolase (TIGR01490 family)